MEKRFEFRAVTSDKKLFETLKKDAKENSRTLSLHLLYIIKEYVKQNKL